MPGNRQIGRLRGSKNPVNPDIPYHFLHEQEPGLDGTLQNINTLFLTGRECVFKCLICDLWKNTLDFPTPPGAIVRQLDYALQRLPPATTIKLYNSSNFFDPRAVPPDDHPEIISRLAAYDRVIVENHPKLCGDSCVAFAERLDARLEVAMGLETIHPGVTPKLNKQMTPADFAKAAAFLGANDIDIRAFVLLNPPWLTGREENIEWAFRTVQFAFDNGAARCTVIPVRTGNGIMELLHRQGHYTPPTLDMLEEVVEKSIALRQGQVFADTWDIGFTSRCPHCFEARKQRLESMSREQRALPPIPCHCNTAYA